MNKHFQDTLYYLTRAVEHARLGARESIDHAVGRVRTLTGREVEPEGRVDRLRSEVATREARATGRARSAIAGARSSFAGARDRSDGAEEPVQR